MLHFALRAEDFHFLETAMSEHLRLGNGHGLLGAPSAESRKQGQHKGYDARTQAHYWNSLVRVAAATGCIISLVLQYENCRRHSIRHSAVFWCLAVCFL